MARRPAMSIGETLAVQVCRLDRVSDPTPSEKQIHVRDSQGIAVGDNNTVINYFSRVTVEGKATRPHSFTISGFVESPYLGLDSFSERDAPFFFGREQATEDIMRRLATVLRTPAPLIVSGVSGAGKSSLLHAGLLPWMGEAGLASQPGVPPWPHLTVTATGAPLAELAAALTSRTGGSAAALRNSLATDPYSLALTARQATLRASAGNPGRLLLIIDQFEQIFTQCPDEAERRAFIAALHAAATTGYGPEQTPAAVVVLVVRADFEARCAQYEELADAVQDRYLVRPMTERQLRLAVTRPAEMLGSSVDADLVEELIRAAASASVAGDSGPVGAGVLPHLSHALDQAWRNRAGDTLTLADYERTGGLEGSIAASAEQAYAALTPAQQAAAQSVFMRLVTTSSDLVVSAGRAPLPDLVAADRAADGHSADEHSGNSRAGDVTAVVEAFAAQRLLTVGEDSVEISHEVLLTAWGRFQKWLEGDRIDMARYSRLAADARDWDAAGRPHGYLYRPGRLEEVNAAGRRWAAAPNRYPPLAAVPASFLAEARQTARRSRQVRGGIIAVLSALTLAAGTAAVVATRQTANANRQHAAAVEQQKISLSRQLAAQSLTDSDLPNAEQLAAAAWYVSPTPQAATAMSTLLTQQDQNGELPDDTSLPEAANNIGSPVQAMAFNPEGTVLAAADGNSVRLWDPGTGRPVGRPLPVSGDGDGVQAVAFSPDGKFLAAAAGGDVQLWNAATDKSVGSIPASETSSVAFSPAGSLLAIPDGIGFQLWNVPDRKVVRTVKFGFSTGIDALGNLTFNGNGTLLAAEESAGARGAVGVWSTATGDPVSTIPASVFGASGVTGIAFDPAGDLLATAGGNGYARIWNAATGAAASNPLLASTDIRGGGVTSVAFSPDGTLLATAGGGTDSYVKLWNTATGSLVGHPLVNDTGTGYVASVAFSPQRGLLASGDSNGVIHLWNAATGTPVGAPLQVAFTTTGGAVSFSSRISYLGPGADGYVGEWSAAVNGQTAPPPGNPGNRLSLFGSPGIVFSQNGSMYAQNVTGGISYGAVYPHASRFLPAAPGKDNSASEIEFSPDGRLLATSDNSSNVTLWDVATGRRVGVLPFTGGSDNYLSALAFSPGSHTLATSSCSASPGSHPTCAVSLWTVATKTRARGPLSVSTTDLGVESMDFSPDGRLLAIPSHDGTIGLWSTDNGRLTGTLPAISPVGNGDVGLVQFSPDGQLLAAMYGNGTIQLWNPATKTPVGGVLGTALANTNYTIQSLVFSSDGGLMLSANEVGGQVTDVTPYPMWQFADPYAALCDEVGAPPRAVWKQYAGNVTEPAGICAGSLQR
jgi:WD40 repeat protein